MSKRILSLLIGLALVCGVFVSAPFTAAADDTLCYLYNKPFENNGYWEGSTSNIYGSAGYFSVIGSNGNRYYLVSKNTMSLGDTFEVSVTAGINDQNPALDRYSVFGIGDYAIIICPTLKEGATSGRAAYYNYAIVYDFDKTNAYSTKTQAYSSALAASKVIASETKVVSDSGGYTTTYKLSVSLSDGVLTFVINNKVVAAVTAADMTALDADFTGFNFDDIKIGMALKHVWKVYENGAYFKDLKVAAVATPSMVDGLINNIPATVTLADEYLVDNAYDVYSQLSDADKLQVTAIDKLNAARVDIVEAYIAALPDGVTSADFEQVDEAMAKYNAISADLQANVSNTQKLVTAYGQMGVIDIIERIAAFGDVSYLDYYEYADLSKDIAKLSQDELSFVYNYEDFIAVGTELSRLKAALSAEEIISDIAALPSVNFTPNNASEYNKQIQNIDLDYVDKINLIRAKINLYDDRGEIGNYSTFLEKELALIDAMEAFNELADNDLVVGTHKKNYKDGVEGEYVTFPAGTVIYAGDEVYIAGLLHCNGYAPNGYNFLTLYNVVYKYNDGSESTSFQPVNGENLLTNLKVGNYKVYHKSWSSSYSTYLLVEFNVVEKPTYNYGLFDVATMLDHIVMSYDEVTYADKAEVEALWYAYDTMDVFAIDDVHSIRNLVNADRYFAAVEDGTIVEEPETITVGDINFDGSINSADVLLLQQHLIGVVKFKAKQLVAANVNGSADNKITAADYLTLAYYCIGLGEL